MRRVQIKNKPFWVATLLMIVISFAMYKHWKVATHEPFDNDLYSVVGGLLYIHNPDKFINYLKMTPDTVPIEIISVKDGKTVWKKGDSLTNTNITKNTYYIVKNGPAVTYSKLELRLQEVKEMTFYLDKGASFYEFIIMGVGDKYTTISGKYVVGAYYIGGMILDIYTIITVCLVIVVIIGFVIYLALNSSTNSQGTSNFVAKYNSTKYASGV